VARQSQPHGYTKCCGFRLQVGKSLFLYFFLFIFFRHSSALFPLDTIHISNSLSAGYSVIPLLLRGRNISAAQTSLSGIKDLVVRARQSQDFLVYGLVGLLSQATTLDQKLRRYAIWDFFGRYCIESMYSVKLANIVSAQAIYRYPPLPVKPLSHDWGFFLL